MHNTLRGGFTLVKRSKNSGGFVFFCLVDFLVFFGVSAEAAAAGGTSTAAGTPAAFFCPPPAFFTIGADEDDENGFLEVFAMSGHRHRGWMILCWMMKAKIYFNTLTFEAN